MIRHLLLLRFKEGVNPDQIEEVATLFRDIPKKIEGVVSVEWGANNSPEQKNKGYTHSVLMNFADGAGRENYLPHPEHNALKAVFKPLIADILVFDYAASKQDFH